MSSDARKPCSVICLPPPYPTGTFEFMRRSRRSINASKAVLALAAKLTREQRHLKAKRAALVRYDWPAFDRLKAHEAERKQASEKEKRAPAQ